MHIAKTERGFSLVEVLIGMALLGILVGGILSVTMGTDLTSFADRVVGNSSCRSEAHRILGEFKNKGLVRSHYSFSAAALTPSALPASGTQVRPVVADTIANEIGVDFTQRWSHAPIVVQDPATQASIIRPYTLIMGTITAVETIYNNYNATVCSAGNGLAASSAVAPLTNIFTTPNASSGLVGAEAFLRIRAYDASGALIACGTELHTRPPRGGDRTTTQVPEGLNSPATGTSNYPPPAPAINVGTPDPNVRDDLSWEVTITISHTNRSGQLTNCSVKERFQYPSLRPDYNKRLMTALDGSTPLVEEGLNASVMTDEGGVPGSRNYLSPNVAASLPYRSCNQGPNANLTINVTHARAGSIFMCRNLSAQRTLPVGSSVNATLKTLANAVGRRQSFFSNEALKQGAPLTADPLNGTDGDMFVLGLYYPPGTYFCASADGCRSLPYVPHSETFTPATDTTEGFHIPSNHGANTVNSYTALGQTGTWLPCEYTQIRCYNSADDHTGFTNRSVTASFIAGTGTAPNRYQMQIANLPPGCEVHLQIAEVDAAYNVRATEVREFIQEPLPGNKLCSTGNTGLGGIYAPNQWHFVCDPDGAAPTTVNGTPLLGCGMVAPRNRSAAPYARAVFDATTACCIDFPGDPDGLDNAPAAGVWRESTPLLFEEP